MPEVPVVHDFAAGHDIKRPQLWLSKRDGNDGERVIRLANALSGIAIMLPITVTGSH
ncbi:MAG: hypothetical protein ACR5LF_09725 [Symbiopectobacterium sp.]